MVEVKYNFYNIWNFFLIVQATKFFYKVEYSSNVAPT